MEHITLYFREGSSDKIYQAGIEAKGGGFVVNFAYGRRGSTLNTGTKTQSPVDYPKAKAIYDKLVGEKTAKGYTPGESGTPYLHSDKAKQATGVLPQLLNPIDGDKAEALVRDPKWAMQEKFDGKRLLIRKTSEGADGINRSGLIVALSQVIADTVAALGGQFIIDGESVGEKFFAFDLLELSGTDLRPRPYEERLRSLHDLIPGSGQHLAIAETASTAAAKEKMMKQFKAANAEGVVFKQLDAPHNAGRPASGGTALKHKFYETASFVVSQVNAQRSVSLTLLSGQKTVPAGNVTIPPNHEVPTLGDVVEVRYLYAFPESGCVYQPVYLGPRDDIKSAACTVDQLKFKTASL